MSGRNRPSVLRATIAALASAAALSSCTAAVHNRAAEDRRPLRLPKMTLDCILIRTIDSWRVLDDYNLVIYAPTPATAYHIELGTYCHPLRVADRIAISTHEEGHLCAFGGDALLVEDQRCPIGAIRPYKTGAAPSAGSENSK
ncbi:MAG: hypothetical protein HY699_06525 [Deltaproteobacteria bacterium]|nr:hypothetical protein [Deltaproteobacteria bacterium]